MQYLLFCLNLNAISSLLRRGNREMPQVRQMIHRRMAHLLGPVDGTRGTLALVRGKSWLVDLWRRWIHMNMTWEISMVIYMVNWMHMHMWLSAIEPYIFLAGFWNLPAQGRFCRIFQLRLYVLCFVERSTSELSWSTSVTALLAWLHRHLRYICRHIWNLYGW